MLSFYLSNLATGKIKHLLTEQLEDDHVVLAQALAGPAGPHDVTDERGPVLGPLLLQDLPRSQPQSDTQQRHTFYCKISTVMSSGLPEQESY